MPAASWQEVDAKALALLIYTSGSTGQPKGCMIEQGNISYNAEETKTTMGLDGNCRVASYASFSFVPTVHDIFGTLSTGGTLYIIPEDIRFDFVRLSQFINDNAITHIIMSTMTGRQFVTLYDCPSLRFLSVGGEKLEPVTPTAGLTFLNIYGSSECCGMITCHAVKGDETNVPIGKVPGTYRLYIVGEDGQQVADGEAGELWVSGPQLCRGYLNHPELTANVFIENPFNTAHEEGYERDGGPQIIGLVKEKEGEYQDNEQDKGSPRPAAFLDHGVLHVVAAAFGTPGHELAVGLFDGLHQCQGALVVRFVHTYFDAGQIAAVGPIGIGRVVAFVVETAGDAFLLKQ